MAIVTDGLDQATLARYRAQVDGVGTQLEALYAATNADARRTTAHRFAWYALGNALLALGVSRGFMDQAQDELLHEGG